MDTPTEMISLEKHYQVRHWTRQLHCTEAELYEAVRVAGRDVRNVRLFRAAMPHSAFISNSASAYR